MKPHIILAAAAGFPALALLTVGLKSQDAGFRDALAEEKTINGDVQDLVREMKTLATHQKQEVGAQVIDGVAPQCLRLDALRVEDEYRVLYRGSWTPPETIFRTGFISGAEKDRQKIEKAGDADPEHLQKHVGLISRGGEPDPYISTSESAAIAGEFAKHGWIYLIHTNRGLKVSDQFRKGGEKIAIYAEPFQREKELAVPGHIPTHEIIGAWPARAYGSLKTVTEEIGGRASQDFYLLNPLARFGSFIKNHNYSGPLKLVGDICPPNF